LPVPHRAPAALVGQFLREQFLRPYLRLPAGAYRRFVLDLAANGVAGGASYDALVAATAAHSNAELISCDRRAVSIYEQYNLRVQLLS
jgi:predicted nucleic acid-binding protein